MDDDDASQLDIDDLRAKRDLPRRAACKAKKDADPPVQTPPKASPKKELVSQNEQRMADAFKKQDAASTASQDSKVSKHQMKKNKKQNKKQTKMKVSQV